MAFYPSCATHNFPGIFQCQGKVPLDIAITHPPEILHTSLWPVPVRILDCPYKWDKRVRISINSR